MLFNLEERIIIQCCIETYNEKPRKQISKIDQERLSKTCLSKLSRLNDNTLFSAQEYTLMCLAVIFVCDLHEITNTPADFDYMPLIDKLAALAET